MQVFVRENEEFSPPQLTIQAILRNSKNSGCNSYVILITNGLQMMDLLQYAERFLLLYHLFLNQFLIKIKNIAENDC